MVDVGMTIVLCLIGLVVVVVVVVVVVALIVMDFVV